MIVFGGEYKGPCPRDCERRGPECHNEKTCEKWAKHVAAQRARREEAKKRHSSHRMSWEERTARQKAEV